MFKAYVVLTRADMLCIHAYIRHLQNIILIYILMALIRGVKYYIIFNACLGSYMTSTVYMTPI